MALKKNKKHENSNTENKALKIEYLVFEKEPLIKCKNFPLLTSLKIIYWIKPCVSCFRETSSYSLSQLAGKTTREYISYTTLLCLREWNINIRPFLFCVSKLCLEVHGEQRAVWCIKVQMGTSSWGKEHCIDPCKWKLNCLESCLQFYVGHLQYCIKCW